MPPELVGRTYGELFARFNFSGLLPIALYRAAPFGAYVRTCPPSKTRLSGSDRVFVLKSGGAQERHTTGRGRDAARQSRALTPDAAAAKPHRF